MRGFGSILWTLGAALAVLSCYLVSLAVASSRADLEEVEKQIAVATRDIRTLETEIGTRGRLAQLERWNVKFLQLSAPAADQFVGNAYVVAAMAEPERRRAMDAPVILAQAPRERNDDGSLVHQASYNSFEGKLEGAGPRVAPPERQAPAAPIAADKSDPPPKAKPARRPEPKATAGPVAVSRSVHERALFDPLAPLPSSPPTP